MSSCEPGLVVWGLQDGEELITPVRIVATLVTVTVTSAWFSWRTINRLSLFFAHWLSGLVVGLGFVVEDMMVTSCWTGSELEGFVKAIKYFELAGGNMFALTNVAICINLALIVMSRRTMARVKSISSPPLILTFLAISLVTAALAIPFWEAAAVLGTSFWLTNNNTRGADWIVVSLFFVGFVVGICMFVMVAWLLLFRTKEIKECWKLHARIRYYFGLTVIGTAVNLGLGICGTVFVLGSPHSRLLAWSWIFRWVHIALDTIVLYGVLQERNMDERGDREASGLLSLRQQRQPVPGRSARRGSGGPENTSKPVTNAPMV